MKGKQKVARKALLLSLLGIGVIALLAVAYFAFSGVSASALKSDCSEKFEEVKQGTVPYRIVNRMGTKDLNDKEFNALRDEHFGFSMKIYGKVCKSTGCTPKNSYSNMITAPTGKVNVALVKVTKTCVRKGKTTTNVTHLTALKDDWYQDNKWIKSEGDNLFLLKNIVVAHGLYGSLNFDKAVKGKFFPYPDNSKNAQKATSYFDKKINGIEFVFRINYAKLLKKVNSATFISSGKK